MPETQPLPEVLLYARFGGKELEPWKGRIVRTEGAIAPQRRMVHAVAQVPDPYARSNPQRPPLAVGLFVKAEISGRTFKNIAVLPRKAVRENGRVLVAEKAKEGGHRLISRKAEVIRLKGDEAIIDLGASEVAGGDLICISTVEVFRENMAVTLDASGETE